MQFTKDLVSVIIPTYNRAGLIARSAKSVLNQTYQNLVLIIVDDGSTDNTEEVVKSLDDKRVIYIKQPNSGACAARNNGIVHAKGEFIAFHDSDDVWHEDKLEKQIKCLKETRADLVFCCMNRIKDGISDGLMGNKFKEGFLPSTEPPYGGSTQTLCAYSAVFKDEKFDVEMPRLQDFELLLRIQKKYKLYYMDEPYVDYYLQDDSISVYPEKLLAAYKIILTKHPTFCAFYKKSLERLALSALSIASEMSDPIAQKELIEIAFKMKKSIKVFFKSILIKHKKIYQKVANLHVSIINFGKNYFPYTKKQ